MNPRAKRIISRIGATLLSLVVLAFVTGSAASRVLVDYWWFAELRQRDTWATLWTARLVPAAIAGIVVIVVLVIQLVVVRTVQKPQQRGVTPESIAVDRALANLGSRIRLVWAGVILLVAAAFASQAGQHWSAWLQYANSQPFGQRDPQFGKDISFYVFELPWWRLVVDWGFSLTIVAIVFAAVGHYLAGGFRFQPPTQYAHTAVKVHLSVLLALAAALKAVQYWLDQYELVNSNRGVVRGASATDVAASLPGLQLMVLVAGISAVLFLFNIRRRGFTLPVLATALIIVVRLIVGVAYPIGYQQFKVSPNELSAERTYIERNIEATRAAFGLDRVLRGTFSGAQELTAEVAAENAEVFDLARLWDPTPVRSNLVQDQQFATYYKFGDGDVDRYTVDGERVPVVVSARELSTEKLPSQSWLNKHLVYTHGYGLVVAPSNVADREGGPDYLLKGLPPTGTPEISRPEIYFGDSLESFAIVGTKVKEFDYPRDDAAEDATAGQYTGKAGVRLDSPFKRLAFSVFFADTRLLISSEIDTDSRILINREVRDRASALAPFLTFDSDPYPVADNGKITWVLDGYTSTDRYPYAQTYDGSGGLDRSVNYVRNSVKVTMDAYDGTMRLYAIDDADPILKTWRTAFPDVFTDGSEMPQTIREHLRYPEDLFRLQTNVYGKYHVTDAGDFYNDAKRWEVADDPGSGVVQVTGDDTAQTDESAPDGARSSGKRIDPYYLLTKRPNSETVEFLLVRPFVPVSNDELSSLSSFMAASSDPETYGQLSVYELPSGTSIAGPSIVNARINGDQEISKLITLLGNRGSGSQVQQGSLQLLPIQNALVYVRPYYIENTVGRRLPKFSFVVVYANGKAASGGTVQEALEKLGLSGPAEEAPIVGETDPGKEPTDPTEPVIPTDPTDAPPDPTDSLESLLRQAQDAFAEAEEALQTGDLGAYQEAVERANALVTSALAAEERSGS